MNKLVIFDGDVFRADEIVYVGVNDSVVSIYLRGREESVEYEYANKEGAREKQIAFVSEWRMALQCLL